MNISLTFFFRYEIRTSIKWWGGRCDMLFPVGRSYLLICFINSLSSFGWGS